MAKDDVGRIYTIHLERPLGHDGNGGRCKAQHYTGIAKNVRSRLLDHRRAWPDKDHNGAKLLAYANAQGIDWHVVDIRRGTFADEKRMKTTGHARRRCPECNPKLRKEEIMSETTRVHETAGNVGIMSARMFTFCCGGCGAVMETFAANLEGAKADAEESGWDNGHRRDLAVMGDGTTLESTWRCGHCNGYLAREEAEASDFEMIPF